MVTISTLLTIVRDSTKKLKHDMLVLNSFYLLATTVAMALFGFLFWLIAARLYSPKEVGIASTLVAALNFITYVALLGFNTTFLKYLPTSSNRSKQINTGLILVSAAGFLVALVYALLAPILVPELSILRQHWYVAVIFALLVSAYSVNLVTDSVYVALRAARYKLLFNGLIAGMLQLALIIGLFSWKSFGIFAAYGIAGLVATGFSIFILVSKFQYSPRLKIDGQVLREVRQYSSANYIANLLNILPTLLLPLIIVRTLGAAKAGYFYLAFMMATLLFTIAYAVSQSLLAEGSRNGVKVYELSMRALKLTMLIMVPASIIMAVLGPLVLQIYGTTYANGARTAIWILAATGPFVAVYIIGCTLLRILKRTRALIGVNSIYILTICTLALLWAPRGLNWVAAAWLAGHAVCSVILIAYIISARSAILLIPPQKQHL